MENHTVRLIARPDGIPQVEHFAISCEPIPDPSASGLLVRVRYLSVEPAMRGWISDAGNYASQVGVGSVMRALAVGEVVTSNIAAFKAGELVLGWFGWQEYAAVEADAIVRRIDHPDLPASLALGVLGINGVAAFLGWAEVGFPRAGETVVVSTAAGAVGSAAGQIAKLFGARTIGLTGSSAKRHLCRTAFAFDEVVNYKEEDVAAALRAACPNGVDAFFDNTGGAISDAVYSQMSIGGRVLVCGTAATPSWEPWPSGQRIERHVLTKRLRVQGFVVFDHYARWDGAVSQLAHWVRQGHLRYREEMLDGIGSCPDAIAGLYRGDNLGKRVIRL